MNETTSFFVTQNLSSHLCLCLANFVQMYFVLAAPDGKISLPITGPNLLSIVQKWQDNSHAITGLIEGVNRLFDKDESTDSQDCFNLVLLDSDSPVAVEYQLDGLYIVSHVEILVSKMSG